MPTKLETFVKSQLKTKLPDIRPGDTVRVHQKIPTPAKATAGKKEKEGNKSKLQIFEGLVIAKKHGWESGATITVRKVVSGVGVERIFPVHSPTVDRIEVLKKGKVRRAKLYYLREAKGRRAKLKKKEFAEVMPEEKPEEAPAPSGEEDKKTEEAKKEE